MLYQKFMNKNYGYTDQLTAIWRNREFVIIALIQYGNILVFYNQTIICGTEICRGLKTATITKIANIVWIQSM